MDSRITDLLSLSAPISGKICTHAFAWCEHSRNLDTLMDELKVREDEARQYTHTKNFYSEKHEGTPILGRQTPPDVGNHYLPKEMGEPMHQFPNEQFRDASKHTLFVCVGNRKTAMSNGHTYSMVNPLPIDTYNSKNRFEPAREFIAGYNNIIPRNWNHYFLDRDLTEISVSNNVPSTQPKIFRVPQYTRGQSMNNKHFRPSNDLECGYWTSEPSMSSEPRGYKVIEGSQKSPELRDTWRPSRSVISPPLRPCSFCRTNGESSSVYGAHTLRDQRGAVVCPILSKHKCELCQATGEKAHTLTYCPILVNANRGKQMVATTVALKASRVKSNGRRRNM